MPVAPEKIPLQRFLAVDNNGGAGRSIDLGAVYGSVYLLNSDAVNPLWFVIGAGAVAPVAPAASDGVGRTQLDHGRSMNLDDIACRFITAITAGAATAGLQIITVKRPGSAGFGAG